MCLFGGLALVAVGAVVTVRVGNAPPPAAPALAVAGAPADSNGPGVPGASPSPPSPSASASASSSAPRPDGRAYRPGAVLGDPGVDPGPDPVFSADPDLRRTETYTYRFTGPGDHRLAAGTYAFRYDVSTHALAGQLAGHKARLAAATGIALYLTGGTALADADLTALQTVHRTLGLPNLSRLYVYNLRTIQGGKECTPGSGLACAGQTARGGLFPYLWFNGWWDTWVKDLILDDLTAVPAGAFSNHTFTSVSMRAVRSVGVMGFGHAPRAKWSVLYLPSVTTVAHDAFRRNQGFQKINLPRVTRVDDYAFDDATSLRYINAPRMKHFGRNALNDSGQLLSVNFPSVRYLGINSLNGLLTGLRLPALRTIDKSAVQGFPNLRWVYAPALTLAWDDAFTHDARLECVYLPKAGHLRVRALAGNPALRRVILGDRPPVQGADVFRDSDRAVVLHTGGAAAWAGFVPAGNPSLPVRAG